MRPRPLAALVATAFSVVALVAGVAQPGPPLLRAEATLAPKAAKSLLLAGARIGARLVAVGEYGNVLWSDDHGATWVQARHVPTTTTLTAVYFLDSRHGWAVGHGGIVLGTQDAGEHWTLLAGKLDGPDALFSVWFKDASTGLAVGSFGYAASTSDGGKTWRRFEVAAGEDGERHLNQIFPGPRGSLWIAAEGGLLFRSSDNGARWDKVTLPYKGSIWGGMALADGNLLVWGMRGHALRSDDGGLTWADVSTGSDQSLGGGAQLADGVVVLAGLGGVVLSSRDGGRHFQATVREDRSGNAAVLPGAPGQVLLLGQAGVATHALTTGAAPR